MKEDCRSGRAVHPRSTFITTHLQSHHLMKENCRSGRAVHPRSTSIPTQPEEELFKLRKIAGQEGRFTPAQLPSPLHPRRNYSSSAKSQVRKGGTRSEEHTSELQSP